MFQNYNKPDGHHDTAKEHWRVLTEAVKNHEDCDPRNGAVYKALQYFQARVIRQGGINLIWAGLRTGNAVYLNEGIKQLRQQLGGTIS